MESFFTEVNNTTNLVCNPQEVLMPAPADLQVNNQANALNVNSKWSVEAPAELANENHRLNKSSLTASANRKDARARR